MTKASGIWVANAFVQFTALLVCLGANRLFVLLRKPVKSRVVVIHILCCGNLPGSGIENVIIFGSYKSSKIIGRFFWVKLEVLFSQVWNGADANEKLKSLSEEMKTQVTGGAYEEEYLEETTQLVMERDLEP